MSSERKQRSAAAAARCDLACTLQYPPVNLVYSNPGDGHDLLAEARRKLTPRLLEPLQTGSKQTLPPTQRAFSPDADRAESLRERERLVRDMFQSATAMQLHNREVEKQLRAERDSLREVGVCTSETAHNPNGREKDPMASAARSNCLPRPTPQARGIPQTEYLLCGHRRRMT